MADKFMMEKESLQPLADRVKILKGSINESINLAEMENQLLDIINEIDLQANLLEQAMAILQEKMAL